MILPGIGAMVAGGKSFPTLRGSVQVSSQSNGSTFSPVIPAHQAGDVLLVVVGYKSAVNTISATGGWTKYEIQSTSTTLGGSGAASFWLLATGSSHTITITNANNNKIEAHAYVWQGAVSVSTTGAQVGDPPANSPSWGADSAMWVAACVTPGSLPTVIPTGFSNEVQTGDTNNSLTTAQKVDAVATQDPSAFSPAADGNDATLTIGIRAL